MVSRHCVWSFNLITLILIEFWHRWWYLNSIGDFAFVRACKRNTGKEKNLRAAAMARTRKHSAVTAGTLFCIQHCGGHCIRSVSRICWWGTLHIFFFFFFYLHFSATTVSVVDSEIEIGKPVRWWLIFANCISFMFRCQFAINRCDMHTYITLHSSSGSGCKKLPAWHNFPNDKFPLKVCNLLPI